MAAKKNISDEVKRFIVKSLAVDESPSEVMESVKEKFNVTITRAGIQSYDPTKAAGEDLREDLRSYFFETRKLHEESDVPRLLNKNNRINKLTKYIEKLENSGSVKAAAALIEQIAKEEGGMFTNRRELTGKSGGPIAIHSKTLDEWNKDAATRTNQAAEILTMFEGD